MPHSFGHMHIKTHSTVDQDTALHIEDHRQTKHGMLITSSNKVQH